jgi:hypothetical protein
MTFRAGAALVRIGPPVPVRDLLAPDGSVPTGAVHALTARLACALRALSLQAEDRDTLALLDVAEACWRAEDPTGNDHLAGRVAWMEEVLDVARRLPAREQPRVETLRHRLGRYQRVLARAALGPRSLPRTGPPGRREPGRTREALLLFVELPFVVGGWLRHLLPFLLTALLVRLARPEPVMEATWKLVGGLVLYPLCWLLEALAAWALGGPWLLAAFLVWLVPGGLWLLAWHGRRARLVRQARAALWARRHRRRCDTLLAERRAIVDDMRALVALASRREPPMTPAVVDVPASGKEREGTLSGQQGASR